MFNLSGQVALITGASRGIGEAAARALGRQGATVFINGRSQESLEQVAIDMKGEGIDVRASAFDITEPRAACLAIDEIVDKVGRIDIFFSNAGVIHRQPLLEYSLEEFERVVLSNLTAPWIIGRYVAKKMTAIGYGRIIFTGSVTAIKARPEITAYTSTKSGIHGMVRQWAVELARYGITVNALAPGYVQTDLTEALWRDNNFNQWLFDRVPVKRWGKAEDMAAAIVFMSSREAGFFTGQVLTVDGGMTISL